MALIGRHVVLIGIIISHAQSYWHDFNATHTGIDKLFRIDYVTPQCLILSYLP